jgi:iron-sulfur cluster assembly accessory protein
METIQLSEFPVKFTEAALTQFRTALSEPDASSCIRIGVRGGGCSGFTYLLDFIDEDQIDQDEDIVYNIGDVTFVTDCFSAEYLKQVTIDYMSSLKESGFKFVNEKPGVRHCGCGSSFSG